MIWKISKKDIGRQVIKLATKVRASTGDRIRETDCTYGVVEDYNKDYIFVKLVGDSKASAQYAKNLEWADDFEKSNNILVKKGAQNGEDQNNS